MSRPVAFHEWPPFAHWLRQRGIVWEDADLTRARELVLEFLKIAPEAARYHPDRNPERPIDPCAPCEITATRLDKMAAETEGTREYMDHLLGAVIAWWIWANLHRDGGDPLAMLQAFTAACNMHGLKTDVSVPPTHPREVH